MAAAAEICHLSITKKTAHDATAYPKRPKFFANQFIRLLTKKCVANELGPQAFTLLTVIAMTEDARGYTDPVTFYNGQLAHSQGWARKMHSTTSGGNASRLDGCVTHPAADG